MVLKKKEVKFNIPEILDSSYQRINYSKNFLRSIYFALENYNFEFKNLPTDGLPFYFKANNRNYLESLNKEMTIEWVIKNVFQDYIIAINNSLIESHRFLNFKAINGKIVGDELELEKVFKEINTKPHRLGIPQLINDIVGLTGKEIQFKEEVLTINKARNCLVHRDGIISNQDINDKTASALRVNWYEMKTIIRKEDGEAVLTKELKKENFKLKGINFAEIRHEKLFKIKESVLFDINEVEWIGFTCSAFLNSLNSMLSFT